MADANATRAAARAGYSSRNAHSIGCQLLKVDQIRAAGQAGMRHKIEETGITREKVVGMVLDALSAANADGALIAQLRALQWLARLHGHLATNGPSASFAVSMISPTKSFSPLSCSQPLAGLIHCNAEWIAYAADANGAKAALTAGYSARSADAISSQLLANPKVRDAIQAEMRATAIATKVTKAFLVQETLEVGREAWAAGARNAAPRGLELLTKMGGHMVAKRDIRVVQSWDDLSDGELRALVGPEPPGRRRARAHEPGALGPDVLVRKTDQSEVRAVGVSRGPGVTAESHRFRRSASKPRRQQCRAQINA